VVNIIKNKVNMNKLKLNLGCASNLLEEYVNIDQDNIDVIRKRYPWIDFPKDAIIYQYDVFNLPYKDNTVDEIIADGFIEHLSFIEERKIFEEIKRVLKVGGKLSFAVPNFEKVVKLWLEAEDNWQDFFRLDEEAISKKHWFGTYTYEPNNRWGYLTAQLYGSQHGEGQFHQNCYTFSKIKAMLNKLGFNSVDITEFQWKGDRDHMLRTIAFK
jgi:predicted SAM-dependent methyltransferase|tara:strand:+ start:1779 stop:2417 length:639 start_codon:yes stop_codon:yes gene_type:complete